MINFKKKNGHPPNKNAIVKSRLH